MTRAFTLTLRARGSLLIGGGGTPDGLHGAHVAGSDGRPIVPASALRGALRETLEALLRGDGQPACDGGSGVAPPRPRGVGAVDCALRDGGPCRACQLFGGGRATLSPAMRDFSSLVLGDARLVEDERLADDRAWMRRPGVAISRSDRSAAEDRLFLRRTTATRVTFVAEGHLRDDADWTLLGAAARATTHLGAGRSRGTGAVTLTLAEVAAPTAPAPPALGERLRVTVTLRAPALFGEALASDNVRDTRREIPGAALRGALGFALAATVTDAERAAFDALVAEDGARFGFLTPVAEGAARRSGALPLTARWCKVAGRRHGLTDVLFGRIAARLDPAACDVAGLGAPPCPRCGEPTRTASGYRGLRGEVPVRAQTRVSIERSASSAREEALFTEVYLAEGSRFAGVIRNVPEDARPLLARALAGPLSLGRARGQGRGRVEVAVEPDDAEAPVEARGRAFDAALQAHLDGLGVDGSRVGRLVPVAFLSPYAAPTAGGDDALPLAEALGGACLLRARRFVREGTWDQRDHAMQAFQAAAAGAVYVVELPAGDHWERHLPALAALEADGAGARRHQGFGELRLFDPIFFNGEGPMTEAQGAKVSTKPLVEAAEAVMAEADGRFGDDAWRVEKTQLNTLIGVCGEATCAEEIANYLRYQASRDRAPWGLSLVERTLAGVEPLLQGKTDPERVDAWRRYAVYLMRSFTYRAAVRKAQGPAQGGRRDQRR
jgi:CRISPR/Cas system CSM-associated protein Csm3 (group 7 of RAMP superfamily)